MPAEAKLTPAALSALGGADNIRTVRLIGTRLRIELHDTAKPVEVVLATLGVRSIARPARGLLHLLLAPGAAKALLANQR